MNDKTSLKLAIALGLAVALTAFFATLQIVSARGSTTVDIQRAMGFSSTTDSVPGVRFVHVATAANTAGNSTYIDHYLTNNNPNAIVFATQNWSPGGVGGAHNNHRIGVWYNGAAKKWAIFNQDLAAMSTDAAFNILVPDTSTNVFVHEATITNTISNWTYIDHPLANNNPNAVVLVTQNWNPGGGSGIYNNRSIGVWYHSSVGKWGIFNQDGIDLTIGTAFNVLVPNSSTNAFIHEATAANINSIVTYIDHPLANDNPNTLVFVTQAWDGGGFDTYNDHPIGVWYDDAEGKWAISNYDLTNLSEGVIFSVVIPCSLS